MAELAGKVAIVTGSARGIGATVAIELARAGANVVVNYTSTSSESLAKQVVDECQTFGSKAIAVKADISKTGEGKELVEKCVKAFGRLDILVNNAAQGSGATGGKLVDLTEEKYDWAFGINTRAQFFISQAAARVMKNGGRIINFSTGTTKLCPANTSLYAATKSAVESFTRVWANELGDRQITVNTVSPGAVNTLMFQKSNEASGGHMLQNSLNNTPLKRIAETIDIARAVVFLASERGGWINGQNILVNGGSVKM
ncbi:hypothetical protein SmJEL517_g04402 [Synchytrium microbalum]|uniref:3-oxoacyl-[acyl-carrier-protein] reductase n=1 Tax=Synchytrium microbalum TaxID=1806994 RepID=A0A507BZE7_9FUNG|nr:uncharacterized protein SmJEL517_g04402 [Synchytrium microbalum]TPX32501.1 hypothetical protein SmJEL517_g04402 [Synchytrium microbalum]